MNAINKTLAALDIIGGGALAALLAITSTYFLHTL
jgi:hypothetical protein